MTSPACDCRGQENLVAFQHTSVLDGTPGSDTIATLATKKIKLSVVRKIGFRFPEELLF